MISASIQLPDELFDRLQRLTLRTGLSHDFYLIEALSAQIGNLENQYAIEQLMPEAPVKHKLTYTLEDMEQELGLRSLAMRPYSPD